MRLFWTSCLSPPRSSYYSAHDPAMDEFKEEEIESILYIGREVSGEAVVAYL